MAAEMINEAKNMIDVKKHPNVVQMLGICEEPPSMVLEFVEGVEDLDTHLMMVQHESQRNNVEGGYLLRALALVTDCSKGLAFLHDAGFVHRDIAPRNIFVECSQKGTYQSSTK